MWLTLILGPKGSGKTMLCTIFCFSTTKEIYTNFKIKGRKYNELHLEKILDLPENVDIFIDEAHLIVDSRRSQDAMNLTISDINSLSRKTFTDLYLATLEASWIDKRLRETADYLVFCKARKPYSTDDFEFLFYDKLTDTYNTQRLPYIEAETYFKFYETYDIVKRYNKGLREFQLLQQNPKAMKNKVIKIIANLNFPKKTHNGIKHVLFMNGYHVGYEKYVYFYLHNASEI